MRNSTAFESFFKQELFIRSNIEIRKNKQKPRQGYLKTRKDDLDVFECLCNCVFEETCLSPLQDKKIQYLSDTIVQKEHELSAIKNSNHSHSLTRGTNTPTSVYSKEESLENPVELKYTIDVKRPLLRQSQLNTIPEFNDSYIRDNSDSTILSLIRKLDKI